MLSICDSLPPPDDPFWAGFDEAVAKALKQRLLVIDLRGVRGGSDRRGMQLARALVGQDLPDSKGLIEEVRGQSTECLILHLNQIFENENRYQSKGEPIPPSLIAQQKVLEDQLAESKRPGAPDYVVDKVAPFHQPRKADVAFKGSIYVLVDAKCGSSCESSLEDLLWHSNVVIVGENSRGLIHFTEQGYLKLPKSRLAISILTKYNEYESFIEKKGHSPNIRVPSGQDALNWLIEKKLRN